MNASSDSPSPSNLGPDAEQFLGRLIRKKARQIICQTGFRPSDRPDIEQELRLKVEQYLSSYRGDRGHLFAFLTAVVERRAASLVRDSGAQKRTHRGTVSLSIQVDIKGEGPVELAALLTQQDADARLEIQTRSATDEVDLQADLRAAIQQLTPDERRVCEGLLHGSVTQVSKDLGIPKTTIHDMSARWREPFENAGLREYL